jgi:hypothetical protein
MPGDRVRAVTRIGRLQAMLLIVVAAFLFGAAASEADAKLSLKARPSVVSPGGEVRLTVRGSSARRCSVTIRLAGRTVVRKRMGRTLRLPVAANARTGSRRVSVRCGRRTASASFRVRTPRVRVTAPGTVVLTGDSAHSLCASTFGAGFRAYDAAIIPRRRVLLRCSQPYGTGKGSVAYDVDEGEVAWSVDTTSDVANDVGEAHFFRVSSSTTPASGLQGPRTTYTVAAVDLVTGATKWNAPINVSDGSSSSFAADEGPSGIADHPVSAVIGIGDDTSAYDAATGAPLWHVARSFFSVASGWYSTAGVVEISGYEDNNYGKHLTGFDARTDTRLWDLRFSDQCSYPDDTFLTGTIEWRFGKDYGKGCTTRHDVATGQLLAEHPWPADWEDVYGDPTGVLAFNGTTLALYPSDNYTTPIWSQPAERTRPLAISSQHVLVYAPSGTLLLRRSDGGITTTVPSEFGSSPSPAREGLVLAKAINNDISVLSMDPS